MGADRSWRTALVVAALVAVALVAVWKLRQTQQPSSTRATTERRAGEAQPGPRRLAAGQGPAEPESAGDGGPVERLEAGDAAPARPMAELLRAAPDEMRAAASECFDPARHPPNSAERVVFRYTVVYRDGEASLSDVFPVDTDMADEDLQNCILDAVEALRWPAPANEERTSPGQQLAISIHDLSR